MKQRRFSPGGFLPLYAMLLVAALLLTVFAGRIYGLITTSRTQNNNHRSALAYVQTQVEAADASGSIRLTQGPQGQALELSDDTSDYVTRIYLYEGQLVEELSAAGSAFSPGQAQAVCAADTFVLSAPNAHLLLLQTNGQQAVIAVHSEGGIDLA